MTHKLTIEEDAPLSSIIALLNGMELLVHNPILLEDLGKRPGLKLELYEPPPLYLNNIEEPLPEGVLDDNNVKEG